MSNSTPPPDVWNAALAADLPGKRLLVGITYLGGDGGPNELRQFHGRVERADPSEGIVLALDGKRRGEQYTLPPDTRGIVVAPAGEYALRSTGEVVVDPDYMATYTGRGAPGPVGDVNRSDSSGGSSS